jgi:hypothetical protein
MRRGGDPTGALDGAFAEMVDPLRLTLKGTGRVERVSAEVTKSPGRH